MIISIKNYLKNKGVDGDIILYRDGQHKKKGLCHYLAEHITTDKPICCYSGGAFGLYMAKAFPNNQIVICGNPTPEYRQQIAKLSNVVVHTGVKETSPETTNVKDYAEANGYFYINQFGEPLIKEYYKQHFADILAEVGEVDAFCDSGHSCATMAGAIASGADLQFVLGVVNANGKRQHVYYLADYIDKFVQETTRNFDTAALREEIEAQYPDFGNIFEATRSISAAMSWLTKNPGKTVLVYVGDSPVFGE